MTTEQTVQIPLTIGGDPRHLVGYVYLTEEGLNHVKQFFEDIQLGIARYATTGDIFEFSLVLPPSLPLPKPDIQDYIELKNGWGQVVHRFEVKNPKTVLGTIKKRQMEKNDRPNGASE